MRDAITVRGRYTVYTYNPKIGETVQVYTGHNLLVDTGKDILARRLAGVDSSNYPPCTFIAIGSGTTPPTEADTTLESEISRKGMDSGYPSTIVSGAIILQSTWGLDEPASQPCTIREIGVFDSSSGGHMLNRIVLSGDLYKDSNLELSVKLEISFE